jgi:hypothetical protein
MRECKSLAEWLESKGNPRHSIAEGENGGKVIVVDDGDSLGKGITIYSFREYDSNGSKSFWMNTGWGLRKEYLPALKKFLNEETENDPPEYLNFEVWEWRDDEEGEYENRIDVIKAVSEYHARALLKSRIGWRKYPKSAWLVYYLNGKKIELDIGGKI